MMASSDAVKKVDVARYYVEFSLAGVRCTSESSHLTLVEVERLAAELLAIGALTIHIKRSQS
jgi:hypothetical protein